MSKITKFFDVYGMKCHSCEVAVENEINKLNGIFSVDADHNNSMVIITFDNTKCIDEDIKKAIINSRFSNSNNLLIKIIALSIIIISIFFLGNNPFINDTPYFISKDTSLIMLFIIGILSSLNCIESCGEKIVKENFKISLLYNSGRVLSYTIIGGIVGAIGSIFYTHVKIQGFIQLIASLFIIIAGLNTVGIKTFHKLSFPQIFKKNICVTNYKNPFLVGYIDGFMPCTSLQTMQLYALASATFINGATSMFVFSIGTVPFMIWFNPFSKNLNIKYKELLFKSSGILIIILGLVLIQKSLSAL